VTNTVDEAIAYARAHKLRDGKSWAGWCASFVFRAGGFERAYPSAMIAGDMSGILIADWHSARRGEIHYWAGVGGDGHVAIDIGGDQNDRLLLMASSSVTDSFGDAVGAVWMSHYQRLRIPYRGHTFAWGAERLAGTAQADHAAPAAVERPALLTPSQIERKRESTMKGFIRNNVTGAIYLLFIDEAGKKIAKPIHTIGEWYAFTQQGWQSAGLDPKDFDATLRTYEVRP
jgi:hypothetical protein